MDYKVVISNQAEEDITEIYSYIYNELKSKINADSVLNRLYSSMNELSFMPESYHLYPNEPWYSKGVHYYSVDNYSIFYVVEGDTVTVIHVCYGRRDLDKFLQN